MKRPSNVLWGLVVLGWFSGTSLAASGGLAGRFVNVVDVLSSTAEPVESLIYGNADYGYFETTKFWTKGYQVSARLVAPGYRAPLDIYLKKRRADGNLYFEKAGTRQFTFPLSSVEFVQNPTSTPAKFTSNYFVGVGSLPDSTMVVFILNRFAEIVWFYSSTIPTTTLWEVRSLGSGKYALLGAMGLFETFKFDGQVERVSKIFEATSAVPTHHDFIYDGADRLLTLGTDLVNFAGQSGINLKPGAYNVGNIVDVDLTTAQAKMVWGAWDDSVALLKSRTEMNRQPASTLPTLELDHVNSMSQVPGKGYLVSARDLDTLLFLDESFRMVWSLGSAPKATIQTKGTALEFHGQHHATVLPNGHILLLDNGLTATRALELEVDEVGQTVSLVREFRPDPPLFGQKRGSVYRLPNGNTFMTILGAKQYFVEFDISGKVKETSAIALLPLSYRVQPVDTIGDETYLGPLAPH